MRLSLTPTALQLKLLRELWRLRMQMLSIALVVATGILSVVTMRGAYESLAEARADYYSRTRFADLWVSLVRAPDLVAERLAAVPGVEAVDTRVTFLATLDLEGVDMPAQGRFVSVPELGRPALNDLRMGRGRYIAPNAPDEAVINEKFATARGLRPGDEVRAVINGRSLAIEIVGIANSPEHSYAVPPGTIFPDDERYGVFWMSEEALGPAYDMDGAFNEAMARLAPDANAEAVMDAFDDLLEPYGGLGAYLRADQPSHQMLENELQQIKVMGSVIPAIFLGVAVFLLHLVLGRLIGTQRGEIAVLKAFGYRDWEVGRHYMMFALAAALAGALIGGLAGVPLGRAMMTMYARYFDVPGLEFRLTPSLLLLSVGLSMAGACSGALAAVRKAVKLPPAEAMRPEAPPRFRPGPLERLGIGALLPSSGRMILRNLERKPLQAFLSAVGVAFSVTILVTGLFSFDSVDYMIDLQFRRIQREDVTLTFKEIVPERARHDLARLEGVTRVEPWRQAAARFNVGHREEEVGVLGMEGNTRLRRILAANGAEIPLPAEGVVISDLLARRLGVRAGDSVQVEWLEGRRRRTQLAVTGVVEDFIGMAAYMNLTALRRQTGEGPVISGAWLEVDEAGREALLARLKRTPAVAGVASPQTMLASFEREMAQSLLVSSAFLLLFASIIAVGVIYNGARISLSERGRELASLRVMGFHRREVAVLLLGEQGLLTLLAIPIGFLMGYGLSRAVATGIETESFRIPFVVDPGTYFIAALVVSLAALASGLAVRRRLDRFSLVEVLKTRE